MASILNEFLQDKFITEVYEYYDIPRLFLAMDKNRNQYFYFWADIITNDDELVADCYCVIPVDDYTLKKFKNKEISIQQIYNKKEDILYYLLQSNIIYPYGFNDYVNNVIKNFLPKNEWFLTYNHKNYWKEYEEWMKSN